jgi:hypothetical protein
MRNARESMFALMSAAGKAGLPTANLAATIWDEVSYEHIPISFPAPCDEDIAVAQIGTCVVLAEDPDEHCLCLVIIGGSDQDQQTVQKLWDDLPS